MMTDWDVTLPASWYTSTGIYSLERRAIFLNASSRGTPVSLVTLILIRYPVLGSSGSRNQVSWSQCQLRARAGSDRLYRPSRDWRLEKYHRLQAERCKYSHIQLSRNLSNHTGYRYSIAPNSKWTTFFDLVRRDLLLWGVLPRLWGIDCTRRLHWASTKTSS